MNLYNVATVIPSNNGFKNGRIQNRANLTPYAAANQNGKVDTAESPKTGNNPGESKIETDPDTTGIDTKADKTRQEIFPTKQDIKQ